MRHSMQVPSREYWSLSILLLETQLSRWNGLLAGALSNAAFFGVFFSLADKLVVVLVHTQTIF